MARTKGRPLVTGKISVPQARWFARGMGGGGLALLAATTSITTTALGALTIVTYTHLYTPMKRLSRYNTELGAVVGAIPPVMGCASSPCPSPPMARVL